MTNERHATRGRPAAEPYAREPGVTPDAEPRSAPRAAPGPEPRPPAPAPEGTTALLASFQARPRAAGHERRFTAEIGDAWGIVYAQGGVVMACLMHAADLALAGGAFEIRSATATFCRPTPCGPVEIDVRILRTGKNGAQVEARLRSPGDPDPSPNAVCTAVFTSAASGWPAHAGLTCPPPLRDLPSAGAARLGTGRDGEPATAFFRHTDWRLAPEQPDDPMRRLAWFSFGEAAATRSDGSWIPALLAVPGDVLGFAVGPAVTGVMGPVISPSLQISLHLAAPARGRWLGIDSRCLHTAGGIAGGVATLWDDAGSLVCTATQTATLRTVGGERLPGAAPGTRGPSGPPA